MKITLRSIQILILFLLSFYSFKSKAQFTDTTLIDFTTYSGTCVCSSDYWCYSDYTSNVSSSYTGRRLVGIKIKFFYVGCGTGSHTAILNGDTLGSFTPTNNCNCSNCYIDSIENKDLTKMSKYNLIGSNSFKFVGAQLCADKIMIIRTFALNSPDNAGVFSVDSPTYACAGSRAIKATIANYGNNKLDSVEIHWTYNGASQSMVHYKTTLDTLGGSGAYKAQITLGNKTLVAGKTDTLVIWTSKPNGKNDTINTDDTAVYYVKPSKSGTYTVGGSSPDYSSVQDAINDLVQSGLCGPVTINLRNGGYNEQVILKKIPGSSSTNTVTIQSESGDSSLVSIYYASSSSAANYTILFDNLASNYILSRISVEATGTSRTRVIAFNGDNENIQLYKSRIVGYNTTSTSSSYAVIYKAYSNPVSQLKISECVIENGSTGFFFDGLTNQNFLIEKNIFRNHYSSGYTQYYGKGLIIRYNTFKGSASGYYGYEVNLQYIDSLTFNHNVVIKERASYAAYFYDINGTSANPSRIYNNFFSAYSNSTYETNGAYFAYCDNLQFVHNNINSASSNSSRGLHVNNGSNQEFYNNVVSRNGPGWSLYLDNMPLNNNAVNFNNYYASSAASLFYHSGSSYNSLSSWMSVTGKDSMSRLSNPIYTSSEDLHTKSVDLNGRAKKLSYITNDIDGQARDTSKPDIGADEFNIPPVDAGVTDIIRFGADSICVQILLKNMGNNTLTSANIGWSVNGSVKTPYSWSGSLNTGDTTKICVGYYKFLKDTLYSVVSWSYNPNGTADTVNVNDTAKVTSYPALNGVYTIGGSSPDFTNFTQAINALHSYGILDSVLFKVRDGVYSERLEFNSIGGAINSNDIVFESESKDSSKVTLQFATNSSYNYVISFNNSYGITFRYMTIRSTQTSNYSRLVYMNGTTSAIQFYHNLMVSLNRNSTSTYADAMVYTEYTTNNEIIFDGNTMIGGSTAIYAYYINGLIFKNNYVDSQYYAGLYLDELLGNCIIKSNVIKSPSGYNGYYGMYCNDWQGSGELSFNTVICPNKQEQAGMYLDDLYQMVNTDTIRIFNNMVSVGGNKSYAYGLLLYWAQAAYLAYNTVNYYGTDTANSNAFYMDYADYLASRNNVFVNSLGGKPVYIDYNYTGYNSDYNNIYSPFGGICNLNGTHYYNFNELKNNGDDSNSVSVDPVFNSSTDLHVSGSGIDKKAKPLSFVTTDIDGETRNSTTPDMGADEFDVPTLDISATAFISPGNNIKPGNVAIKLTVRNSGIDTVVSFKARAIVNKDTLSVVSVTDTLLPGDTMHVVLGSYTFVRDSINSITAWTYDPNNSTDQKKSNDTLRIQNKRTAMSGVYTIGGTSPDFATFKNAVSAMVSAGIADSVRFRVRSGTYNEQVRIPAIDGAGARHSIIFESEAYDSLAVTLTYNSTQYDTNYVVYFDGSDGVTFRKMHVRSTNTSYNCVFRYQNGANYNTLTGLKVEGPVMNWAGSDNCLVYSDYGSISDQFNEFKGNAFLYGGYGIWFYGNTSGIYPNYFEQGTLISDNLFLEQYDYPVFLRYQNAPQILRNRMINNNSSTGGDAGVYLTNSYGRFNISGNQVQRKVYGRYAIYTYDINNADSSLISNNMVDLNYNGGTTHGMYLEYPNRFEILYNTIRLRSNTSSSSSALYIYYGSNNTLLNNILVNEGPGYAMYLPNNSDYSRANHNNFRTNGTNLIYYNGSNYTTLSGYTAASGKDSNSLNVNPEFLSTDDLHIKSLDLNMAGVVHPKVSFDYDGQLRDTLTPDIGADEFTPPPIDAGISSIITPSIPFRSDTQYVKVVLRNYGSVNLSSAVIEWNLNGVSKTAVNWTGSLNIGDTAHIILNRMYFHPDSAFSLTTWSRLPNSQNDTINWNDTAKVINQYPALSGIYTIGGASPDFATFEEAVTAMRRGGIIDSVLFNVRNGTYFERIRIGKIIGANRKNAIVFQSENGDSSQVVLNYTAQTWDHNYTLYLDSAIGITFRKMTISGGNTSYGTIVRINGNSKWLEFSNNIINGSGRLTQTTDHSGIFIQSNNAVNDSFDIRNNDIMNTSVGIYNYGYYSGSNYSRRIHILGNKISAYYTGIFSYYIDSSRIENNRIELNQASYSQYGTYSYYNRYMYVNANQVNVPYGYYGTYFYNCDGNSARRSSFTNNMVYCGSDYAVYGVYFDNSDYVDVLNNNVYVPSTNGGSEGVYFYYGSQNKFNSNVVQTGAGTPLYLPSSSSLSENNYNCYQFTGSNIAYWNGTNYSTLAAFKSGSGREANSIVADPMFVSATDLHVRGIDLNEKGLLSNLVKFDFDGEKRDSIKPDIGADEFRIPGPDDAGISAYISPVAPFASGNQNVKVLMTNYGSDTLKSATIHWTVNGTSQTAVSWTGNVPSGRTDTVSLGTFNFAAAIKYTVKAWPSQPNGKADTLNYNDTLTKTNLYAALAGIYTIGGTLPDFNSFADAVSALHLGGVLDTVTFKVRNGTYNEQFKLMSYPGSQSNRPVTFTSESGDSSKVIISYSAGSSNNYVVWLNGADYITLSRMTIQPTYYYYGYALVVNNGSLNCNVSNNMIRHTNPGYYYTGGVYSTSDIDNNLKISGNTITGFYYGAQLYGNSGSSANYETGLNISGNHFSNIGYTAIYLNYQKNFNISGNTISNVGEGDMGIYLSQTSDAFTIQGNKIINAKYSYNIYISGHIGNSTNKGRIFNNFLSNYYYYGYILRMDGSNYVDIDYNSMNFHTVANYQMLYFGSNSNYNLRNNSIAHNAGGVAMYVTGTLPSISNYNNWYTSGSVLMNQAGTNRSNLAAWKAATSKDANSLSVNPLYFSNDDLHTTLISLDSAGTNIAGISTDIDGDTRNSTRPDIGADEFNSLPDNIGVSSIMNNSGCELDSQFIQVAVFNFGSNRQSGFKIKYSVNGVIADSLTTTDSLNSGQSRTYTFAAKYKFNSYSAYPIRAWTDLSNETYRLNDTATKTITNYQTVVAVGSMIPTDSTVNVSFPVTLSWSPVTGATLYDVYVWADSMSTRPGSPLFSNTTQISIQISSGLGYGVMYKWQVVSKNPSCAADGPVQRFRMRYLPDLTVSSVSAPVSAFSGNSINVSWVVKNTGTGSTGSAAWWDLVYMSSDKTYDGSDVYLGGAQNTASLNANQNYSNNVNVTIPNGTSGKYYFIIRTDVYGQVTEVDDGNNIRSDSAGTNITLTPPPDLVIASVQAPGIVFSGTDISVRFTVKNQGTGETRPDNWYDGVYLSKDSVFNGNAVLKRTVYRNLNLDADSTYSVNTTVNIPVTSSGFHYIYLVTDLYNNVYEHSAENNNRGVSDTIDVLLTPPPDLIVRNMSLPDTASGRKTVTLQYNVINQGGSKTFNGWYDQIYISSNPVFNPGTSTTLGHVYHNFVDADDTLLTSRNVTIPDGYLGKYYIYVFTDVYSQVFEGDYDTNNVSRASIEIVRPDLRVSNLTGPSADSSGNYVTISWRVTNHGPGDDPTLSRKDKIFLSSHHTYHKDSVLAIDSLIYTVSLNRNAFTDKSKLVRLPNGIFGNKYLYVFTDIDNNVYEVTDTNNWSGQSIQITLSPYPDLTVNALLVPDTSEAGSAAHLVYQVKNQGLIPALPQWKDRLYLSKDSVFNLTRAIPLSTITRTGSLNVSGTYEDSTDAIIPGTVAAGNYYFYTFTDFEDKLYEYLYEGNNVRRSKKIYIDGYPPVDLALDSVIGPDSAYSGTAFNFTWRGKNIGDATTLADFWYDRSYLSLDSLLDPSDILLGEVQVNIDLAKDSTYSRTGSFTVPNGTSGSYYLIVKTDHLNSNNDFDTTNNTNLLRNSSGVARKILIKLSASPDLKYTAWTIPSTGTTGQPVKFVWEVKNEGNGATLQSSWVDRVYLSTDFTIDASDYILGSETHHGILAVNGKYKDSAEFTIPSGISGNRIVIFRTDETNLVYEHNAENNNTVASAITLSNAPPANLMVSSVNAPTSANSGSDLSVDYTVKNIGSNPASGWLRDNVYLSADTTWDATDVLFSSSTYYMGLLPGNSVTKTASGTVSGVSNGDYYFIVYTDILNNITESADTNNTGYSNSISIAIPELPMHTLKADTLYNSKSMYYRLIIPDSLNGESVLITLKGDSINGNNELYVRYGDVPSRSTFDFAYDAPFEGNQELLMPEVQTGTYYILVYGSTSAAARQHVTLYARKLNFEIRKVTPTSGGNTGQVTVKIEGSKFTDGMLFYLSLDSMGIRSEEPDSLGDMYSRSSGLSLNTIIYDPTVAYVTFNLKGQAIDTYHVVADKGTEITMLKNGFQIVSGLPPDIQLDVSRPSNTRTNAIISFKVEFSNKGNTDLVNQYLEVTSNGGAAISFTPAGLSENKTTLNVMMQEDTGPTGLLRPNGAGSAVIYTNSTTALGINILLPR